MFVLPLRKNSILTSMNLNDSTIERLLKVGFKPHNLAGRVMYTNGEIHIVDRDTVAPVYIPKFTLHSLTNIVFEDKDVVMDMVAKLNTHVPTPGLGSRSGANPVVTITNSDRVLSFEMSHYDKCFILPRTEEAFNNFISQLDAVGVDYDLHYRHVYAGKAVTQPDCVKVDKDNSLGLVHYLAVEGSGRPDPHNFTFCAGDLTDEKLPGNLMVFNIFNMRVSCVVDAEYLQTTAELVGKEPEVLLDIINRRFARQIGQFIADLCYHLDIKEFGAKGTVRLLSLLNPHI